MTKQLPQTVTVDDWFVILQESADEFRSEPHTEKLEVPVLQFNRNGRACRVSIVIEEEI